MYFSCLYFFLTVCKCVYIPLTINNEAVYIFFYLYRCFIMYLFTFDDESLTINNEAVYIFFCLHGSDYQ